MAKTPARIKALMAQQQVMMRHVDEILRVKKLPLENQAPHVREKSTDYYIGLADGCNAMLENALFTHNCYAGFAYQVEKVTWIKVDGEPDCQYHETCGTDHPEYAGWRRKYYERG